ncbi:unnamed protein product, partial [Ectocarpus sp. 4 AP-2014]
MQLLLPNPTADTHAFVSTSPRHHIAHPLPLVPYVSRQQASQRKLGTVKGVFQPCVQNILGVILFIRLPFIVGQAGVFLTIVIILVAKLATTLTTLSMNAIATNGQVQAGGPYYIISRNLGVEV